MFIPPLRSQWIRYWPIYSPFTETHQMKPEKMVNLVFDITSHWRILEGRQGRDPLSVQFFSFSCSFQEKIDQDNRLAPPPLGLAPPPLTNPGSATVSHLEPPSDPSIAYIVFLHNYIANDYSTSFNIEITVLFSKISIGISTKKRGLAFLIQHY